MRCPYCGVSNADHVKFCAYCGRSFTQQTPPASRQPQPPRPTASVPPPSTTPYQKRPAPPSPSVPPSPQQNTQTTQARQRPPTTSSAPTPTPSTPSPSVPKPDVQFPPRTMAQLQMLKPGKLPYTLISDTASYGKKRIVRIAYRQCPAWQQVATLMEALNEYQSPKFDTIIIQGVSDQAPNSPTFTLGQLVFDRNTRLGDKILDRYQIETGNGFTNDSVRIVLSE